MDLHGTHFPVWWLFLIFISFLLLRTVLVTLICFRLMPFLNAIIWSVLKVFSQLWFACNMCQCFVTISFKFVNARPIMNGIHYHKFFVVEAVVFDRVGQFLEFAVWQHLFCILYKKIVQYVFQNECGSLEMLSIIVEFEVLGCRECFYLMSTNVMMSH